MKIMLIGADGQVGWALRRALAPVGEVFAVTRTGHEQYVADLSEPQSLSPVVAEISPDVIVNAAAYTAVDKAETEPELAQRINAEAPAELARMAKRHGALLIHYSTDYVFDGSGDRPWREDDPTGPMNVYGRTKLAGEQAIKASGCRYLMFRTSWVYAAHGQNFLKTMLRLACERSSLQVVSDQFGAPAGADYIADVTAHALCHVAAHADVLGLYHLTPAGEASWYDYTLYLIGRARELGYPVSVTDDAIHPVNTEAFPTPATRPANSRLDGMKLEQTFNIHRPDWRDGVDRVLDEQMKHQKEHREKA